MKCQVGFFFLVCGSAMLCIAAAAPITESALVGKWYTGDGLGYNVDLTLRADSSYDAVWTGCLGTYGTAKGRWHFDGRKLTFAPTDEKDMMRNHLRTLTVIPDKHKIVLVPPKSLADFKKWGSDPPFWCYVRAHKDSK